MKRISHSLLLLFLSATLILLSGCIEKGTYELNRATFTLQPHNLKVSPSSLSFDGNEGGSATLAVLSENTNWTIVGLPYWLTEGDAVTRGEISKTITLTASPNISSTARSVIFFIQSSENDWGYSVPVTVTQSRAEFTITPSVSFLTFDGGVEYKTIDVSCLTTEWTATPMADLADWCDVFRPDAYHLRIDVQPNTLSVSRTGHIELATDTHTATLTVTQRPAGISSTLTELYFAQQGGTKSVGTVTSDAPWTAQTSNEWLSLSPSRSEAGSRQVTVTAAANNSLQSRTGYIYLILSDENKQEIKVEQEGIQFSVSNTSFSYPSSGGEKVFTVNTNAHWIFSYAGTQGGDLPDWLSLSPSEGVGTTEVTLKAARNPNDTSRSTTLVLRPSAVNAPVTLSVTQEALEFEVTGDALNFGSKGGSMPLQITTNSEWVAAVDPTYWFSVTPSSGTGSGTITVTATPNTDKDTRHGKLTVFCGDVFHEFDIAQQGTWLDISSDMLHFTSRGGSETLSVSTDKSWTATADEDWITLSPSEGKGDVALTVTAADNPSVDSRLSFFTLTTSDGMTVSAFVEQDARYLTVETERVTFGNAGGNQTVNLSTDGTYEVTSDASWLSFSKYAGSFIITAAENTTTEAREADVTVSLSGLTKGKLERTVHVIQTDNGGGFEKKPYLTFEAIESAAFKMTDNSLQYSLNDGLTWTTLQAGKTSPTIQAGERIMWKASGLTPTIEKGIGIFNSTGRFNVEGNIMSLIYGDDFDGKTSLAGYTCAFHNLFYNCEKVVNAKDLILPATTLASNCYESMFRDCVSLTTAPAVLPATTLAASCYQQMFRGCVSLTTAPDLPATTMQNYCYQEMFTACKNLTSAPALPATKLSYSCYNSMFYNCTSLTTAPELPATELEDYCYYQMFSGCTKLNYIKCLAIKNTRGNCTRNWVNGVASTGTFVKAEASSWSTGVDGIPEGWTVKGDSPFSVTPTNAAFAAEGGSTSLSVSSNLSWTASANVNWISLSADSGTGDAILEVTASANTSIEGRSGEVTFVAGGTSYKVSVTQAAAAPTFSITPTAVDFHAIGGSKSITVNSNQSWTVSANEDWITLSKTSGSGNDVVTITASAHISIESRAAKVTFVAGGTSYTVSVTQAGGDPIFSVTPTSVEFTAEGGSGTLTVKSNQPWTASSDASWLTISKTSGTGDAELTITVEANTTINNRTAEVTFVAGSTSNTAAITQFSAAPTFGVTPMSAEFSAEGGSKSITITSNQTWTASVSDNWILLSNNSGNGNATLTVTASANTSIEGRSGEVTFVAGGTSYKVSVTQSGATPTFSVTPTSAEFSSAGGSKSITISSNQSWTVSYDVSWISMSHTYGDGNATITITAQPNYSLSSRSGIITFVVGDAEYYVPIVQERNSTNGHEYVDLGLPSGTLWATCNIGATSPEIMGDLFAWAETTVKDHYGWDNYKYCSGGTYNTVSSYTIWTDYFTRAKVRADNRITIELKDDAAHVNWGGVWRMPSTSNWEELMDKRHCTWTWTTLNGVEGYEVESLTNGNSLFIPDSGYWTTNLNLKYCYKAWGVRVDTSLKLGDEYHRSQGLHVRAVCTP